MYFARTNVENKSSNLLLKIDQPLPLFVFHFRLFHMTQYKLIKVCMVCLGLKPRAAGWKVQTYPLSYGGTHAGDVYFTKYFQKRAAKKARRNNFRRATALSAAIWQNPSVPAANTSFTVPGTNTIIIFKNGSFQASCFRRFYNVNSR